MAVGVFVTSFKIKVRNFEFSVNLFDILQNHDNFTKVRLVLWEGRQFIHVSDFQTHVLTDKYTSCFCWYFVVSSQISIYKPCFWLQWHGNFLSGAEKLVTSQSLSRSKLLAWNSHFKIVWSLTSHPNPSLSRLLATDLIFTTN